MRRAARRAARLALAAVAAVVASAGLVVALPGAQAQEDSGYGQNWRRAGPPFYTFEHMCSSSTDFSNHEKGLVDGISYMLSLFAFNVDGIQLKTCKQKGDYLKQKMPLIDFTAEKMYSFRPFVHIIYELVQYQKAGGTTNFKGLFLSGKSIDPKQTEMLDILDQLEGFRRLNLPKDYPTGKRATCPLRDKRKCV